MFNMRHVLLSQRIKHFLFFWSSIGQIIQFYQSKVKNLTFPIMSFLSHAALLKANKRTYWRRNSISEITGNHGRRAEGCL